MMSELNYLKKIRKASEFLIQEGIPKNIDLAIILGSGLGGIADEYGNKQKISYKKIPFFEEPTVEKHEGNLYYKIINGKKILFLQGRLHLYEGYSSKTVTFPIRVLQFLHCKKIVISNAAGGVTDNLKIGDIMLIVDHINLMGENPLVGNNFPKLGKRFPSMRNVYSRELIKKVDGIAKNIGLNLKKGVYVGLKGPSLETNSEYKMVKIIGGDAVGMSTVPEVITAAHAGIKVIGFSIITNIFKPEEENIDTHEKITEVAEKSSKKLIKIVKEVINDLT